jgi:hypothetical protein
MERLLVYTIYTAHTAFLDIYWLNISTTGELETVCLCLTSTLNAAVSDSVLKHWFYRTYWFISDVIWFNSLPLLESTCAINTPSTFHIVGLLFRPHIGWKTKYSTTVAQYSSFAHRCSMWLPRVMRHTSHLNAVSSHTRCSIYSPTLITPSRILSRSSLQDYGRGGT